MHVCTYSACVEIELSLRLGRQGWIEDKLGNRQG